MSQEVKRYYLPGSAPHNLATVRESPEDDEFVPASDFARIEAERDALRTQLATELVYGPTVEPQYPARIRELEAQLAEKTAQCEAKDLVIATYESDKFGLARSPDEQRERIAALEAALRIADQFMGVASDWNFDECEIDGEMKSTSELCSVIRAALAGTKP